MTCRSPSELFELAEGARHRDDVANGAAGARGYGFALADQYESRRWLAGGANLANLPSAGDVGLTARVLGLVRGRVALEGHVESLYRLTLCAVSPQGGQRALSCYCGPSGHAIGGGATDGLTQRQGSALAAAWEEALRKAPAIDFQLGVQSDFGRAWLVVQEGRGRFERKQQPGVPPPPSLGSADATQLAAALAAVPGADTDPCAAFDLLYTAWETTQPLARKPHERACEAKLAALWQPALDALEAGLASGVLSPAAERAAGVLIFPQHLRLDRARQDRLYKRWRARIDRSATAW